MAYKTWHHYGYGICVSNIKVDSTERLENLLSLAPQYRQQIHNWFEECEITEPTVEDYLDFDQDYYRGLATIMSEVIQEAEGIDLLACDNYDGIDYLIYEPKYPWQISERDAVLTEEKLRLLFAKYVNTLTDQEIEVNYKEVGNEG